MHGRSGLDFGDVGRRGGRVAPDVGNSWILDALLRLGVLGLAGDGPVFGFGDAVDNEAGEGICDGVSFGEEVLGRGKGGN